MVKAEPQERLKISRRGRTSLVLRLEGKWCIEDGLQHVRGIQADIDKWEVKEMSFDVEHLKSWDSSLVTFLVECLHLCRRHGIILMEKTLPEGIQRLLALHQGEPEKNVDIEKVVHKNLLYKVGESGIHFIDGCVDVLTFFGESVLSAWNVVRGKGHARWRDFLVVVQEVGVEALPIVALISFLVGFIMAFVAAIQLEQFGASIYVANLVGLAMVREMGAMMTGVIMSGRTGAAFAATLGSMKVTEEIDALRTTGISPIDFLVVPRLLALFLMMPLLCIFSDFIGIIGGLVVSMSILDVTFTEYVNQTRAAISLTDVFVGVSKATVFGMLIAVTGCLRGMQCGNSSSAVGLASTSAVVTAVTALIAADAIFAVLFDVLNM